MSELNLFQKLFKRKSVASAEDAALMPSFESTKAVADSAFSTSTTHSKHGDCCAETRSLLRLLRV